MAKYVVRVAGTSCKVRIQGTNGAFSTTSGFYTTRFVEVAGREEAQRRAFALVRSELAGLDVEGSPHGCRLSVDEIREDSDTFDKYAPGSGLTWF